MYLCRMNLLVINILLIVFTALVVVAYAKHTQRAKKRRTEIIGEPKTKPINSDELATLYDGNELLCRVGYLHYGLTTAEKPLSHLEETERDDLTEKQSTQTPDTELFVGYAIADKNKKNRIIVCTHTHRHIGAIDSQEELYTLLLTLPHLAAYGYVKAISENESVGEACIESLPTN